ncbi:MAG: hypothetical protein ACREV9_05490 [Burkholderiales bacterium]
MKRIAIAGLLFVVAAAVAVTPTDSPPPAKHPVYNEDGFHAGAAGMTESEKAGREIWFKATAGNDRFHTYVFQQRIGVLIDWFRVLDSEARDERFETWGLINDPSCCKPGSPDCPAKSLEETYGFDWCPGDETLLNFVGKNGYRDPACDLKDLSEKQEAHYVPNDLRESACHLAFGTSTGALGFRKFPNPRFQPERWREVNGGTMGTWAGYNKKLTDREDSSDKRISHLFDGSIEPPFLVGMSCGACHIAFDPLNPPKDPTHPAWENIKGAIGNQYIRISEIMVSGMPKDSLEWQVFAHARPGTSDTSAVPTDQVNNPGTINAIHNFKHRPVFDNESVLKWRFTSSCEAKDKDTCWCEPGKGNKCWTRSLQKEPVHHVLKDGGDSIGIHEAVQRVYNNIGSCSEQCWLNHLTDLRVVDPQQRSFGQTPFNIGQCRRDCPNFRAIEDRLSDIVNFLLSKETDATDLVEARKKTKGADYTLAQFRDDLEKEFGEGAIAKGRAIFADKCASCHSSEKPASFKDHDFHAVSDKTQLRQDFLSNDKSIPVSEVGTFRCRALHSNHMKGHVWEEFASETYREKAKVAAVKEDTSGGRGYYRNISLVSLWAHAPFMHNNALGPELCGAPADEKNNFYRSSYVGAAKTLLPSEDQPACWPFDPGVEGRYKLFKESVRELLNPKERIPKITKLDQDIVIDLGPKVLDASGEHEKRLLGFELKVPAGTNAGLLGNFQHKPFVVDLVQAKTDPAETEKRLVTRFGPAKGKEYASEMRKLANDVLSNPKQIVDDVKTRPWITREVYVSCTADVENAGHEFGGELSDADKQALTAFLATL